MKKLVASVAAGLAVASSSLVLATPDSSSNIPVIVVFAKNTPFHQFAAHAQVNERAKTNPVAWGYLDRGVLGAVQRLERLHRFRADHVYSHATKGFAAVMSRQQLEVLRAEPTVDYIEIDREVTAVSQTIPEGVNIVNADDNLTVRAGNGSGTVENVNAYVIDTGIGSHADLTIGNHVNFVSGSNTDCNGHGTHVAGTIGAIDNTTDVVGIAPGIMLHGVKVLNCFGKGTNSSVVKGVDWVTANAIKPAVANMSLSGSASRAMDDAVVNSAKSGIFYAIAAGNDGDDACKISPARIGKNVGGTPNGIVTTAATNLDDPNDTEASFSNYGDCVDVWAPGVGILSTKLGGGTAVKQGTSMAAPHAAGSGALVFSLTSNTTPEQAEKAILDAARVTGTASKDKRPIHVVDVKSF